MGISLSFGIILFFYLVVGYLLGLRFLREVENEEDAVILKRNGKDMDMILMNRRLTLTVYSLFWFPLYAFLHVNRLSRHVKKNLSIIEKEWNVQAGISVNPMTIDCMRGELEGHLIGRTMKWISDVSPLLEDDLITVNITPGECMIIETVSIKGIQYQYEQVGETDYDRAQVLPNQPIIENGVEVKVNGFSFMCEGKSVMITLSKFFGKTYVRFEAERDDDYQEVTFELL
jgi:hypothetical protein